MLHNKDSDSGEAVVITPEQPRVNGGGGQGENEQEVAARAVSGGAKKVKAASGETGER